MGFFSRGPKMPEYVLRAGAWQSFAELMDNDWDEIAGSAWEGYQIGGRGFVMLDTALGGVAYIPAAAPDILAAKDKQTRIVRADCARYNPEREFVLVLYGANDEMLIRAGGFTPFLWRDSYAEREKLLRRSPIRIGNSCVTKAAAPSRRPGPHASREQQLWPGSKRYRLCMPGIMDAVPEASQREDVMAHTAYQLNASMERVRQARQLLHEASDRLTQTRQEVEKDERLERVRRAREHLDEANQHLARTRQQLEEDQHPNAVGPTTDN